MHAAAAEAGRADGAVFGREEVVVRVEPAGEELRGTRASEAGRERERERTRGTKNRRGSKTLAPVIASCR